MKIIENSKVTKSKVEMDGAENVDIQILIGENEGSDNIIMRKFTVAPGGHTPYHTHNSEHVVKVEKGNGVLVDENGNENIITEGFSAFVPPNQTHQFKNISNEPFEFLCIIVNPNKAKCCG